jgi:hypothetical protein
LYFGSSRFESRLEKPDILAGILFGFPHSSQANDRTILLLATAASFHIFYNSLFTTINSFDVDTGVK